MDSTTVKLTKGERTAQRIMTAAEGLFARNGFEGTTLRDVAEVAGIREPGIYNHFSNKEDLYCSVLQRSLVPIAAAIDAVLADEPGLKEVANLSVVITELLAEHPLLPALFQQALMSTSDSPANNMMNSWLDQLFQSGSAAMIGVGGDIPAPSEARRRKLAVRLVAMFNLCSGYFLSQRIFDRLGAGDILAEENLRQQKLLLAKINRMFLLE